MIKRIEKLRKEFKKVGIDALFVTNHNNVTYLTGFLGLSKDEREGFLLITRNNGYLLTFPTYFGLYKKRGEGFNVLNITYNKRFHHHLNEIIDKEKIKTLGVEKESLTISESASLRKKLKVRFRQTESLVENLRLIKEEKEIASLKKAAKIADSAFEFIRQKIKKGVSEKELALELEFFIKRKADDIAFSPIVAFNQNTAIPHYLPSNTYHLKPNTLILLDFGAKVNGYCSDMTRVLFFGKPKNHQIKTYLTVLRTQELALKKLKAGLKSDILDKLAKKFLRSQGYPEYQHGLGHGVGLSIHEDPRLKKGNSVLLKENMVVTIEPGVYFEGQYGIRIEDLVVLRKEGIEILSKSSKKLESVILRR
jgi:Xaa-Pro aminopeptidase